MLLQVLLHLCNNNGFAMISDVIILFCPPLDDWILCRIVVGKKCGLAVFGLVKAPSIMYTVFQLYDACRFVSTVAINLLINISSPKLKEQISLNFEA